LFDIGFGEFIVVVLVALVVFGPEKLADSAEKLGKIVAGFRRNWNYLNSSSMDEIETKND
jgi:TatA/E family protein of Tat protein translocase